jgi:hypothetical protein
VYSIAPILPCHNFSFPIKNNLNNFGYRPELQDREGLKTHHELKTYRSVIARRSNHEKENNP